MRLAMIGLGRMGGNMARRLLNYGHEIVGYNLARDITDSMADIDGFFPAYGYQEILNALPSPRVIWCMVPAGDATESVVTSFGDLLSPGDILIDGGNSNFHDTMRRSELLKQKGIHFIDVGVSGGVWGLQEGYSLMIGGDADAARSLPPIFEALAPSVDTGWGYVGPSGAGHYVKMVHNGIEYGLMEAYAEGFELLAARKDFNLNTYQISQIWREGSVVRSWLLDLIGNALVEDPDLSSLKGYVADSGEGRWTIIEGIDQDVPMPVIAFALYRRFYSRQGDAYSARLLAAMRNQFGGHAVVPSKGNVEP